MSDTPINADPFNCPDCGSHDYGLYAPLFGCCPHCMKRENADLREDNRKLALHTAAQATELAELRAKLEQERDIREDRETTITLLAKALKVEAEPHQSFFDRLLEAAEAAHRGAACFQWGVKNARWIRHEHEAYVAIPVARDADLSCVMTRLLAIDAAMQEGK